MPARSVSIRAGSAQPTAGVAARSRTRQHTTPAQLRQLLIALVGTVVVLGATATVLQRGLQATTGSVRGTTSPAYLDAAQALASLSDADRAAWQSFRSGEALFNGPGQQYQNDITTAGQALERLAALQAAGSASSSLLQTISGELVSYQSQVEQADVTYQKDIALGAVSKHDLGFAYLAYASSAMRARQGGLLANISELAGPSRQALSSQLASPWANPALLVVFTVPALFLIAGIALAQSLLRRRFNRALSPPLLLAAALVVVMSVWLALAAVHADSAFAAARATALPRATALWQSQTSAVTAEAAALRSGSAGAVSDRASGGLNETATAQADGALDADLASAQDAGGLPFGIPVLAVAIAALAYLGLWPRLSEYRGIGDR
jgi:hypothetical protein